jgi:hypothetical protein
MPQISKEQIEAQIQHLRRYHIDNSASGLAAFDIQIAMLQGLLDQPEDDPVAHLRAKTTDSRFASYLREYGDESWELDALEPKTLVNLVRTELEEAIDFDRWEGRKADIEAIREKIQDVAAQFEDEGV